MLVRIKETEALGLILMSYDYQPDPDKDKQNAYYEYEGEKRYPIMAIAEANNILQKMGYFGRDKRPTEKLYKLLKKYNCGIKQLDEYKEKFKD